MNSGKLISMVAYNEKQFNLLSQDLKGVISKYNCLINIKSYTDFLKQSLEIWMFIPCKLVDDIWVALNKPKDYNKFLQLTHGNFSLWYNSCFEYQEAEVNLIFKGFEIVEENKYQIHLIYKTNLIVFYKTRQTFFYNNKPQIKTLEDLTKYNIELTDQLAKKLGLWEDI